MKKTITAAFLLTILSGCTSEPVYQPSHTPNPSPSIPTASADDVAKANRLLQQGQREAAAKAYFEASYNYPSPQKERLILQAAEIATYIKNAPLAKLYLASINPRNLDTDNRARYAYTKSLIALLEKNPQLALDLLPQERGIISAPLWEKITRIRHQAYQDARVLNLELQQSNLPPSLPSSSNRIAVLLPLSGKLGALGQTILDGIRNTQQQFSNNTRIQTYDMGQGDILTQYRKAIADGADLIIGPLDKRKLSTLIAHQNPLPRPVVSLNHLAPGQGAAPAALYQFGLSPEDEARQVAGFALARNHLRAAVMYPNSQWGNRLAKAFKAQYARNGGQIVTDEPFPNSDPSYAAVVNRIVAMKNQVDMIFLAASPTQARLIRPMLQHKNAGNIPVYATSHIYSGKPDSGKNVDLDGIVYTEIPYLLTTNETSISSSAQAYPRLYALGADALLIAKNLSAMASSGQPLEGKTGAIRLGGNRYLQRQLSWATFVNGLSVPLNE